MCVILCLLSALSRRVDALQISFIIIINAATLLFSFPYKAEGRSLVYLALRQFHWHGTENS